MLLQFYLYFHYIVSLCWQVAVTLQRQNIGWAVFIRKRTPMAETQLFI